MKTLHTWQKRTLSAILAGSAVVMLAAAPLNFTQAADAAAGASTQARQGQRMMPRHPGFGSDARIDQMVQQGKITSDQADKLKTALKDFQEKQHKERQQFLKSLPDKTGISEETLRDVLVQPRFRRGPAPQARMQQLVKDGSITQDEATALETYFKNHHPQRDGHKRGERPDFQKIQEEISNETGISTDRLQEIGKLMHPRGPQGEPPQCDKPLQK